ncbi:holin family protein [Paenibacillus sp. GCM10012306]|uniref:phage holin family protein n=1 Tax=Paenibacillus sp. GCM10012306 TaxID=3317342 RepID=UPI00361AAA07
MGVILIYGDNEMENLYKIIIGASASVVTYFFGGWSDALALLAFLCVLDYMLGIAAAAYEGYKFPDDPTKGINSNRGFWGIFKKFMMFSVIAILYRVDLMLELTGTLGFMVGATSFYIGNELFSLAENYGRLDLPMPKQMRSVISVLRSKSETVGENEDLKQ